MIKQKEYAKRRSHLMEIAGDGAIVILRAATQKIRNNDANYPYRQDSDFLYLSGFSEPESMIVLLPPEKGGRSILFCRERDRHREMWDGNMAGLEGAVERFGFDEAFPIGEMKQRLPRLLHGCERIYYDLGKDPEFDQLLIGWLNEFRTKTHKKFSAPDEIIALDHSLH